MLFVIMTEFPEGSARFFFTGGGGVLVNFVDLFLGETFQFFVVCRRRLSKTVPKTDYFSTLMGALKKLRDFCNRPLIKPFKKVSIAFFKHRFGMQSIT